MAHSQHIDDLLHRWASRQACGYLSGGQGGHSAGLTRPEAGAQRQRDVEAVAMVIETMLIPRHVRLIEAHYLRRIEQRGRIARELRLNPSYVSGALDDVHEQIHKMLPIARRLNACEHKMLTPA